MALLADGSIEVDQRDPDGWTPLMIASHTSRSRSTRTRAVADDDGISLHSSDIRGHLAVIKMLVNAGADLEAATFEYGHTPLYLAAEQGQSDVMSMLIEAGANPNCRCSDGASPLYIAAHNGHKAAVKTMLRAKANPALTTTVNKWGRAVVPLDLAAQNGHLEIVRELIQQVGVKGCGGASGGVESLRLATVHQHLDIMALLMDAGIVDDGRALSTAVSHGRELSVKFLLQQKKRDGAVAYVNYRGARGATPLLCAIDFVSFSPPSPRVVRLLVDAGADTTSAIGFMGVNRTPLDILSYNVRSKTIAGKDATEEHLHRLESIRRLLLRVHAVHAASFLWPVEIFSMVGAAEGAGRKAAASIPLTTMLPILRRRARRPRVLLVALFR